MSEPVAVPVPQINPNDEHATVVRWHVAKGARVRSGQALVTLETTKTTFDVDAPCDGYAFFEHEPHAELTVGAPVAWIADSAEPLRLAAHAPRQAPAPEAAGRFTRKALKLMKERGLRAADFPGDERIDADAVERVGAAPSAGRDGHSRLDAEPLELPPSKGAEMRALRRVHEQALPSTVAVELDSARLDDRLRRLGAEHDGTFSLLEVAIHEVAQLLTQWPELNGFYGESGAWRYRSASIGVAVNLGRGLKVPVVKGAAQSSLREVARAVRDLSLRYMRDELTIDDLTGGTFTITDLSAEGVVHFVPVLNERQSAILGLTAERGSVRTRELVLTFDHRLSDGMRAGRFLVALRARLEGAEE